MDLKNYIDGQFKASENTKINTDILNNHNGPKLVIHFANKWDIVSAIESVSKVQSKLTMTSDKLIQKILSKAMDYYLTKESDYILIAEMTGSPLKFTKEAIEYTKDWVRQSNTFLKHVFGDRHETHHNSSPTFAILPSNSEQEALYVISQSLMAKSAIVVKPSTRGVAGFASLEFAKAWSRAVDEISPDHSYLKSAVNIVNIEHIYEHWHELAIDDWNYVCFGSDNTIKKIKASIDEFATPRKMIAYGTGLSITVVDDSCKLPIEEIAQKTMDSISVNRGNECISTDVVYIHARKHDEVLKALMDLRSAFKSLSIDDKRTIGLTNQTNCNFIMQELTKKGKQEFIYGEHKRIGNDDIPIIHTSIVPISDSEIAIEYPGPIASIRSYSSNEQLVHLMQKDLEENKKHKSLACSIYSDENFFDKLLPKVSAYTVKLNKPTHMMDLFLPHQGIYLIRELSDMIVIEK